MIAEKEQVIAGLVAVADERLELLQRVDAEAGRLRALLERSADADEPPTTP